ncbi:hypothetical protein [Olsenella phocaeensis]|uniref:hypothetical protein n=1 Tax=Olsenella phocaeensis TaxID=1852385 RepID=UPI0009314F3E|nr:hypothetical protein [Olsenella phocaeensis]
MIVKAYCRDGRMDVFDTANLTDASVYRGNIVTNWSLDLSGAMREGGMLLLSMRWYPAPGQDAPAEPEGLPIARRRDGLCVVVADSEDVPQISMVTVDSELALLRVGDGLVDCNHLAWASRIADGLPTQAISAHRTLSMFVGNHADGIDIEAEICRLMGFDPATYALMEDLSEMTDADKEDADGRLSEDPPT